METQDVKSEATPEIAAIELTPTQIKQLKNDKLRAAIARVLERGGASDTESRYDRDHHRHNKS